MDPHPFISQGIEIVCFKDGTILNLYMKDKTSTKMSLLSHSLKLNIQVLEGREI